MTPPCKYATGSADYEPYPCGHPDCERCTRLIEAELEQMRADQRADEPSYVDLGGEGGGA